MGNLRLQSSTLRGNLSLSLCSDGSMLSCCDVDDSAPQIPPLCHSGCFTNVCPRPFLYVFLPGSCRSPSASLPCSDPLDDGLFQAVVSDDVTKNVSSSFSSFVSLALASFLIVLKSRRWSCAAAMILAAVAGMSTFQMPLFYWWLSLSMPTIHTRMWQQRRRWLWLCVVIFPLYIHFWCVYKCNRYSRKLVFMVVTPYLTLSGRTTRSATKDPVLQNAYKILGDPYNCIKRPVDPNFRCAYILQILNLLYDAKRVAGQRVWQR